MAVHGLVGERPIGPRARGVGPIIVIVAAALSVPRGLAATLVLTSEPVGATIVLNGADSGVTPKTVQIPDTVIGAAQIEFRMEGYFPSKIEVTLVPQQQIALKAVLVPVSAGTGPPRGASGGNVKPEPPPDPSARQRAEIRAALDRFRADCGGWPAALTDLCVPTADQLSARTNGAGDRLRADGFRGPYLAALPGDPSTGATDWHYDSSTGLVRSRSASIARLEGIAPNQGSPMRLGEWLELFLRAAGMARTVEGGASPGSVRIGPTGPARSDDWRPL